ncbi:hypothetical protein FHR33_002729 [Nonomuraea dietziae]|uniref:Uncharacterized protein n=1 Tax=Nonomuraea dietziae TaxID=65515 RepID=A0A7W5V182_9ACTN|nr:hypothetical protein [Nonomuraea dietziae]
MAGDRARDRRQQVAPEDPQLRGAQPALGRQVWCRLGLLQQRRGVHGERGPCHQPDGERGPEDPRPVQRGHHQSGEHRWQGVDHLRRARREPGQEPDDQADEVSGQAHQDGDPHGRQRAVAHAGQHVAAQAVGAQRRVAGGGGEPRGGVERGRVAQESPADDGKQHDGEQRGQRSAAWARGVGRRRRP